MKKEEAKPLVLNSGTERHSKSLTQIKEPESEHSDY